MPEALPQAELEHLVARVLQEAQGRGATAAESSASFDAGLSLSVRMGEVETLEFQRDRGLGVTVYYGQRKGHASTSDFTEAAVRETVAAACSIARFTAEDECAGLAPADRMATVFPDLDLHHPWDLSPEQAIELAVSCERAGMQHDSRINNSDGTSVTSHSGVRVYGNSHGFLHAETGSSHSISCSLVAQDSNGKQRDYWYDSARCADDLQAAESIGLTAAQRTVARLGARRVPTQRVPVLYAAPVARGLIGHFLGAIRGGSQYRKTSYLLDAAGRQVFPEFVNLEEAPHRPRGVGSAAFDGEGVATEQRLIVENGVLNNYLLSSYSARKLGLQTTGNAGGVHNLLVHPGEQSLEQLLNDMQRGLLITELMGHGINMVTGDYSRGAAGFWVEQGQIQFPVEEITVAGNLADMLLNIRAIGNDVDTRGNTQCGSILVDEMMIAGE